MPGVFAGSFWRAAHSLQEWWIFLMRCLPDALLGPFEIPLGFSSGLESFVEVCSETLHAALCHGLQLEELLLLSAHLTGANFCGSLASNLNSNLTAS